MPVTEYTYSISADVPAAKVDAWALDQEIRSSAITIALDGVEVNGDVLKVTFKDALPAGDKTTLDGDATAPSAGLVGAHTGDPLPDSTFTAQGNPIFALEKRQADGAAVVTLDARLGKEVIYATHNLCDPTTWYSESTRVTDHAMVEQPGAKEFTSNIPNWVDLLHGKVFDEDALSEDQQIFNPGDPHGYGVVVKVDGVEMTMRDPFATDFSGGGDYYVDYVAGAIHFDVSQAGKTVTASFSHAGSSAWIMRPLPNKALVIEAAEVQFAENIQMNSSFVMEVWGLADYFAPQLLTTADPPGPLPPGTPITLSTTAYKTIDQLIDEATGAHPAIPIFGGTRGYTQPRHIFQFRYTTVRTVYSTLGMYIRILMDDNAAFSGERATATFYCTSEDDTDPMVAITKLSS